MRILRLDHIQLAMPPGREAEARMRSLPALV